MKKITPIIMVRSLDIQRGGVTKATIKRANVLANNHKEVIILTFMYQQYYNQIIQQLYEQKILNKKVKVFNFFEELKPKRNFINNKRKDRQVEEKNFIHFAVKNKEEPSYRYYKDGLYMKYKRFNSQGTLKFIDYMDESGKRKRREEFNEKGILVRTRHMDNNSNKPRYDQYFDNKGECFLSVHVNPKTGKEGRVVSFLNNPKEYSSFYDCQLEWLNCVLNKYEYPVVSNELRRFTKLLINVQHKNIKKIEVVHTSHLNKPYNDKNNIKPGSHFLFENAKYLDWVVFLTNEQKQDVVSIYGKHNNFTVIPHSTYIKDENVKGTVQRDSKLAVTLARYHEDKRLDEAIHAFKLVVEKIPEAKYYIYGYGELKDQLQNLIVELDLENNVYLKPFTSNPQQAYREAACSVLTSRQEGFAMVITESMAVGTPVIAYNIKYGPKDIISNGHNGYLIEEGNRQELSQKIIKIMENQDIRKGLSTNSLDVNETFSEERYRNNWFELYS
ncbi:glycosyltransferase [Virgibacillus salarius]